MGDATSCCGRLQAADDDDVADEGINIIMLVNIQKNSYCKQWLTNC